MEDIPKKECCEPKFEAVSQSQIVSEGEMFLLRKKEDIAGPAEEEVGSKPEGCERALACIPILGHLTFLILDRIWVQTVTQTLMKNV